MPPLRLKKLDDRDAAVVRVIIVEGSANLLVFLVKLVVGLNTGSLAVLSDAVHSLTDLANNALAWFVVRMSAEPPDRSHPYGHRKFETLAVFALAALLTVLAFQIVLEAFRRQPHPIGSTPLELALLFGVLGVNIAVSVWERRRALALESKILLADASHTLADVGITLTVIAGWQLSALGYHWVDRLCAGAVAALVLYLAYKLFRDAVPVLVDESSLDPAHLARSARAVSGVRGVYRVRSRWIGTSTAVDLVITVDPDLPTRAAHDIANDVEIALETEFGTADVSIHVEPDLLDTPSPQIDR